MSNLQFYVTDVNPSFFGLDPEILPETIINKNHVDMFLEYVKYPFQLNDMFKVKKISIGKLRPDGTHYFVQVILET